MKKKWLYPVWRFFSFWSGKTFKIMKISVFLFLTGIISMYAANSYSQTTRLSLDLRETTVGEVLTNIENQSEFYFLYSNKLIDVNRKVSLRVINKPINNILDHIFADTEVRYIVFDRQIILSPEEMLKKTIEQQNAPPQEIVVTGKVTDEDGNTLPGVNIVVKGTLKGTITDADGNYSIEVDGPDAILVFSFIGYRTQEVNVAGRAVINITLAREAIGLEEVVAIGYGTRLKGEITGSVSSVSSDELIDMVATNVSETLKGTVSGVTVIESHTPGGSATVRIRGMGTINNNDPLWIIDGVPGAAVNPNNVESISVLKDASAQAIYGARASNGVILVTTKSGKRNQELQVNLRMRNGVSKNINSYDLLNTREYGEYTWLMAKNEGIEDFSHTLYGSGAEPDIPEYIYPARETNVDHSRYDRMMVHEDGDGTFIITKANKEGTDWMKEIEQVAGYQEYALDVSGGGELTTYSFMVNYLKEEGIMKYTDYERYNLRSNITFNVAEWLQIGEKIGVTYSDDRGNQSDNSESSVIHGTQMMQPIVPVYDIMGNFAGTNVPSTGNGSNPVFRLWSNQYDHYKRLNTNGNIFAKANIIEGLSFTSLFGFLHNTNNNRNISYVEKAQAERGKYDGLSESSRFWLQWNWFNTLEYSKTFAGVHDITLMAGSEAVSSSSRWRGSSRVDYYSRDPNYMQIDVGTQDIKNNGNYTEWKLFSLFGRLDYAFGRKYLFAATFRRDGSSRFGSENRYGIFPAFSVGWRLTEENFMAFSENWLDNLKIRFGWGQTGNDQIGNYNGFTTFDSKLTGGWHGESDINAYYPIAGQNNSATAGFQSGAFGNPDVRWEVTTTTDIGIDAVIFNNIDINLDVWKRETDDMLYPKKFADVVGQASLPSVNVGTMKNTGFDIAISYGGDALNNDLQYNVALNLSHYKTEIVKLSGEEDEFIQGAEQRNHYYTRIANGTAFPEFYGYIVEGIFQSQGEADNHPPAFGNAGTYNEPGHFKYKDVNGDGVIDSNDRTFLGSPHPDFIAGLNLNLQYKSIYLTTRLYTSYGNMLANQQLRYLDFNLFTGNRSKRLLYESWGSPYLEDNNDAVLPKAEWDDSGSQVPSTHHFEDASYLRMEYIKISYDLSNIIKWMDFRSLQISGQITNVFTLTNYSGMDPEVNATGMRKGVDLGSWPTARQFLIGLNIGF